MKKKFYDNFELIKILKDWELLIVASSSVGRPLTDFIMLSRPRWQMPLYPPLITWPCD